MGVGSKSIFTGSGRFSSITFPRRLLVAAFMSTPSSLRFAAEFLTSTSPLMSSTLKKRPAMQRHVPLMH